jgi:hypothetical protein
MNDTQEVAKRSGRDELGQFLRPDVGRCRETMSREKRGDFFRVEAESARFTEGSHIVLPAFCAMELPRALEQEAQR